MPPRVLAAALAVALAASGTGCGAGGDRDDVRAEVSSYLSAAAQGNGRQACAYYTAEMRRQVRQEARRRHKGTCQRMMGTAVRYRLASLPGAVRRGRGGRDRRPRGVDVDMLGPDRARRLRRAATPPSRTTRATLVRTPDGWRIERLEN